MIFCNNRNCRSGECIVNFGTDSINGLDCADPYKGYTWCFFEDRYPEDTSRRLKNYESQFLPKFEKLKNSIVNGLLPEMDALHSLDEFMRLYENNGLLFQKPIHCYETPGRYFEFISNVRYSEGKERMNLILSSMSEWGLANLPKIVREYLESVIGRAQKTPRQSGALRKEAYRKP